MNFFRLSTFFLVFLASLFTQSVRSQTKIDSLFSVSEKLPDDTAKVNLLISLANEQFWAGQYEKALETAATADTLATDLFFMKGQGNAMIVCGQSNLRLGRYEQAEEFFSKAITIFTPLNKPADVSKSRLYLGQVFDYKAEYNMALEQYRIAQELAESIRDSVGLTKILNSTGITNFNKGNYQIALEHYLSALKMTPLAGNEKLQATIVNNIGVVHVQLMQYEDALKYFHRYVDHMKTLKGTHGLGVGYLNIGETYKKLGRYEQAIQFLTQASLIQSQSGDKKGLALSCSNMGDVYKSQQAWVKASENYDIATSLAREIQNDEVLLNPLTGLAELKLSRGMYGEASRYLEEARALAVKIESNSWRQRTYLISSKLDSARGDFKSAYSWFKKYAALSDSLFNEEKSRQVFQMKELYESERKDKEIRLLSEANKLSEVQRASEKNLFTLSLAFMAVVLVISIYWLVLKVRHSKILKIQRDELSKADVAQKLLIQKIENQKSELAQRNTDLQELHHEKDGLIGVVVHDLRSPLNRILGLSNIVSLAGEVNPEQRTMLNTINKVCEDGNKLIGDLLEINEYESDEKCVLEMIDVVDLTKEHLQHFSEQVANKKMSLILVPSNASGVLVFTNPLYLRRILDNLLSNAIKFSPAGRNIWVEIKAGSDCTRIVVRDEGPGFSKADLPHLFKKFKKLSARPTAGESSTGLGLSIVKLLTNKIGGALAVESQEGRGASFIIELPSSNRQAQVEKDAASISA